MGVGLHFLDSGAFTIHNLRKKQGKKFKYKPVLDRYAAFIKKHKIGIDYYANLDVIGDPEWTLKNQLYLEKRHGLRPVPVVHYGSDPYKWLELYHKKYKHEMIGLGGVAINAMGKVTTKHKEAWIEKCFEYACGLRKDRLPAIKLHGFGIGIFSLIRKFPWFSVDSTMWFRPGCFGVVLIPPTVKGNFDFSRDPLKIIFSEFEGRNRRKWGHNTKDFTQMLPGPKTEAIKRWLIEIGIDINVLGHNYRQRNRANIFYLNRFVASLPKWPWPYYDNTPKFESLF